MKPFSLILVLLTMVFLSACSDENGAEQAAGMAADTTVEDDLVDMTVDEGIDLPAEPDTADAFDVDMEAGEPVEDLADEEVEPELPPEPDGPPQILLTVNEAPAEMNGSQPYYHRGDGPFEFMLLLPTFGFTLDLYVDRAIDYIDVESIELECDDNVGEDSFLPNLAEHLEPREDRFRWLVPQSSAFVEGTIICRAMVANLDGEQSDWSEISFNTQTMTPELHPFDPADVWVITFSRDNFDVNLEGGVMNPTVVSTREPDGEPDFVEDLRLFGFLGDESGEGAATFEARGQVGVNAVMLDWLLDETMAKLRTHYGLDPETGAPIDEDSVQMTIYWEGDSGAPDASTFDGTFSIHGVGGDTPPEYPDTFGMASSIDIHNLSAQDDGRLGYGSFSTNVARLLVENPAFRGILSEFIPVTGTPMGDDDWDVVILSDDYNYEDVPVHVRGRRSRLLEQVDLFTKMQAALIAHEMGHSLGLIPWGAPPKGLFGGVYDSRWMLEDTGGGHIDVDGLNIMQRGGSLMQQPDAIFGEIFFYPLAQAYLQGRLIVLGQ